MLTMNAENTNEAFREKMNGMAAIPDGFTFRQEEVWQHLESRLQRHTKKKHFLWMFAAATVFFILVLSLVYQTKIQ